MKQNSWLISDSLIKRSLAIWGHAVLGYIIVAACFAIIFGIFGLLVLGWEQLGK